MKKFQRIAAVGAASTALVAAALATAPSASADSYNGCVYPRVCFYLTWDHWNSGTPTAGFQDVTTAFQNLGPNSAGSVFVRNTRNDDRAYLRYIENGETSYLCLKPNRTLIFSTTEYVNGIRIDTAATCP